MRLYRAHQLFNSIVARSLDSSNCKLIFLVSLLRFSQQSSDLKFLLHSFRMINNLNDSRKIIFYGFRFLHLQIFKFSKDWNFTVIALLSPWNSHSRLSLPSLLCCCGSNNSWKNSGRDSICSFERTLAYIILFTSSFSFSASESWFSSAGLLKPLSTMFHSPSDKSNVSILTFENL